MERGSAFRSSRWAIALAAGVALIVGGTPMLVVTFGVLLKTITEQTGWSRADASTALSFMLCSTAIMSPIIGLLIDRFGVKRPLVISILATACVLAAISSISSLPVFWLTFFVLGLVSPGLQPVLYSKVVVEWFDDRRGLALGVMNAGQGIGSALMPIVTGLLLAGFGWRGAYLGLALCLLVVTLPGALFIIREHPDARAARRAVTQAAADSAARLARTPALWLILVSAFVMSMTVNGTLPHLVPLLTDRGYSVAAAISTISVLGLAGLVGRLGTGYLVDLFFAPYVALGVFTLASIGMGIIWADLPAVPPVVGVIFIGAGIGAEIDLMSYLTSRYFARDVFGRVYGVVFFSLIIGQAIGAFILGETFQIAHTYAPALGAFALLIFCAGLLSLAFRTYTYPPATGVARDVQRAAVCDLKPQV